MINFLVRGWCINGPTDKRDTYMKICSGRLDCPLCKSEENAKNPILVTKKILGEI